MNLRRIKNIIEALSRSSEAESIDILEELGTNCPLDEIRRLTSSALIKKNDERALRVMITKKGKGIHDLSSEVAMNSINELLSLKDKTQAIKLLEEAANYEDKEIQDIARSTKALMTFSS